ncbi:M1 family metallopeptidase [Candidatus Saccharibacteria bacterium]|nr:M1 family metallopeptidase [Candidatus Saccharibacteria bacterium]
MERLLDYFIPKNYNLSLNINKSTRRVYGTAIITGEPLAETIKFHAKNLKITSVTMNGNQVDYEVGPDLIAITPRDFLRQREQEIGSSPVTTGRATGARGVIAENQVQTVIKYTFYLNTNMQGAYLSSYQYQSENEDAPHTEYLVSTQFESHYARECFPCIDEPAAKATFDLKLITPDADDTVISNMPAKSERVLEYESVDPDQDPSGGVNLNTMVKKKIVEFETTPKMSTYLLAFCLGRFHKRSKTNKNGIKVTTYCALNQDPRTLDFANDIAADSLDYYDKVFDEKYPLPKLDQVAIPDFEAGAMENWGLVTYRESCLLAAPGESKTTKEYIATVIAHELSHQWFGNLVTMKWWDNLWLNESFANMMEYVCIDAIRPRYHIWEYFFTGECRAALNRDALPGVQAVQQEVNDPAEIATLFDGAIVYAKGAHLMFMLMRLMGEKAFFKGLRDYFNIYKYTNTTGDDLWGALQPYAKFDIKEFMDAWIMQPGFPVITDGNQQRFLLTGATDDTVWPLPEVTDDMSGHYIINLSSDEFNDKLKSFKKLSLEQKIRLLIDRSLLAKTSLVSSATHLDLIAKFKKERNYAVWNPVLTLITDLKLFIGPLDADFSVFQKYIYNIISDNLKRLGLEPSEREDDNDSKLRQIMVGLAIYSGDEATLKALEKLYKDDFEAIHPDLRGSALIAKLRLEHTREASEGQNNAKSTAKTAKSGQKTAKSGQNFFNFLLEKYQTTADPNIKDDILGALADVAGDTKRQIKLLDEHEIVRPQDHLYLFVDLLRNYKTRSEAIKWLYDNWNEVVEMTGEKSVEDYPRLLATSIRTTEEAEQFSDFFTPLADNPVLTRTIAVAKADIDARLRLLSMDYSDVHAKLTEVAEKI